MWQHSEGEMVALTSTVHVTVMVGQWLVDFYRPRAYTERTAILIRTVWVPKSRQQTGLLLVMTTGERTPIRFGGRTREPDGPLTDPPAHPLCHHVTAQVGTGWHPVSEDAFKATEPRSGMRTEVSEIWSNRS